MAQKITGAELEQWNVKKFDNAITTLESFITSEKGAKTPNTKQIAQWEAAVKKIQTAQTKLKNKIADLEARAAKDPSIRAIFNSEVGTRDVQTISLGQADKIFAALATKDGKTHTSSAPEEDIQLSDDTATDVIIGGAKKQVKKTWEDMKEGKGRSVGIVKTLFGVGVASYATKGVTTLLANAGIISSPMGLMGVAKAIVPKLLTTVTSALSSFISFNPAGALLLGGALAIKALPTCLRLFNKAKAKYLEAKAASNADKNSQSILSDIELKDSNMKEQTEFHHDMSAGEKGFWDKFKGVKDPSRKDKSGKPMAKLYTAADMKDVIENLSDPAKIDAYLNSIGVDPKSLEEADRNAIIKGLSHVQQEQEKAEAAGSKRRQLGSQVAKNVEEAFDQDKVLV